MRRARGGLAGILAFVLGPGLGSVWADDGAMQPTPQTPAAVTAATAQQTSPTSQAAVLTETIPSARQAQSPSMPPSPGTSTRGIPPSRQTPSVQQMPSQQARSMEQTELSPPMRLLADVQAVGALCAGLRPFERLAVSGGADEQARPRPEHRRERERLMASEWALELPWSGFTVARWDETHQQVTLLTERPFRVFEGALRVFELHRDAIVLAAAEGHGAALREGLARGALSLALVFRPDAADPSPCVVAEDGRFDLAVEIVSAELRRDGQVLAGATLDAAPSARGESATPHRQQHVPEGANEEFPIGVELQGGE